MQKKVLWVSPFVMNLNRIDPWYWCRYFVDVYPECPFGCSYCHTLRKGNLRGVDFIQGLPGGPRTIGLGLISDVYHPDPAHNRVTRSVLDILWSRGHSISIQTKSVTILHDLNLLERFTKRKAVQVTFTILTCDSRLASKLEGCAPSPGERLAALRVLTKKGIAAGVAVTPIIPFLTDDREALTHLIREAKRSGASWVLFSGLNLLPSLFQQPYMRDITPLYSDEARLNRRYREIKHFMVSLLHEEGLPMRIPRLNPDPADPRHLPRTVSEYLFNISYLYELLENTLQSKRYWRAAHQINELEGSLKSIVFKKKLGYIKGINPEIERVIGETVMDGSPQLYETLYRNLMARASNG